MKFFNLNLFVLLVGIVVPFVRGSTLLVQLQNQKGTVKPCLTWGNFNPILANDCTAADKKWKLLVPGNPNDGASAFLFQMYWVDDASRDKCLQAKSAAVGSGFELTELCNENNSLQRFRWTSENKIKLMDYPDKDLCIGSYDSLAIVVTQCTPTVEGALGQDLLWKDASGSYVPPEETSPPTLSPIIQATSSPTIYIKDLAPCTNATVAIDVEPSVHGAYMDLVEYLNPMEKQEIDNQTILFDDFSLAKYEGRIDTYETKCEAMQGAMVSLNYELECSKSDEAPVIVFVRDQPRCYSKICDDGTDLSLDEALFMQFAVQETQDRANDHHSEGMDEDEWTCTGNLFNYETPGACEYQSGKIADSSAIIDLSHLLVPTVGNTKLFWIIPSPFPTSNQIVTMPNASELKEPCEASGGVVVEFPEVRISCTDPLQVDADASVFEVKGHTCLGNLCDYASGGANSAILKEAQARLVKADILGDGMECTVSSDAFRISVGTLVASIALVSWYIF
jgi:hypothetical protein